jgi:hypothetical protein
MQDKRIDKFTSSEITTEHMRQVIGGLSSYYKQALAQLVIQHARTLVQKKPRSYYAYGHLLEAAPKWRHHHYVSLAHMIDLSESTTKRLFGCYACHKKHEQISKPTLRKLAAFIGTDNLEEKVLGHIFIHGVSSEQ